MFGPSVINEVLVGYSHTTVTAETFDWAGVGAGNAKYGIAGGQPIDGLSQIGWGSGLTLPGAIATDSDTLAKTYQINEKLTWLKGRHALKFGGQFLRYDQRRFYAGNNGLLGSITYNGAFTGFAFSDFLLDQVSGKGRGGGDPNDPWTHLQNRIALFVQDDFKVNARRSPSTWACAGPTPRRSWRRTTGSRTSTSQTGEQIFASERRTARSTSPTTRASSRASASPGARATAW